MAMPGIFLYGTLCWDDILQVVAGPDCPPHVSATLADHSVHWVAGQAFPMIAESQGAIAQGWLLRDPLPDVIERLAFYEGPYGYVLNEVTVEGPDGPEAAYVFVPPSHLKPGEEWDMNRWIADHGPMACEAVREVMARFHIDTPNAIVGKYPMMQVRASARLSAQANPSPVSPSGLAAADVSLRDFRLPYANFFSIAEFDLAVPRYDGSTADTVTRAGFMGTDAAIVLPYDPIRDRVLLVEQFRVGPYARSDKNPWMMEPIAGRVDAGEPPVATAHREAKEEAGLSLSDLHLAHSGYASPGCSTEYFHVYVGLTDLPDDAAQMGGLDSEAEDIKGYVLGWDEFYAGLVSGQYPVTPLALAGYWLAHNRATLRPKG